MEFRTKSGPAYGLAQVWSHAKFKLNRESFLQKLCQRAAKLPLTEGRGGSLVQRKVVHSESMVV